MRKPFVAGNWKMHKNIAEARQLVAELVPALQGIQSVDQVLCPPFVDLMAVAALLEGTSIGLGAQNMYWETSGAFTGEISPLMVAELCEYVIIGHSERRAYFNETDETVNRKAKSALSHGLIPIICVGETLEEYEAGKTADVVTRQIRNGLAEIEGLSVPGKSTSLVIAYEPVWAIGTGKPSNPEGAAKVIREMIRKELTTMYNTDTAQDIRVLYGGSVNAKNAGEFFSENEIDGALVGGASLKASEFVQIVQAAAP